MRVNHRPKEHASALRGRWLDELALDDMDDLSASPEPFGKPRGLRGDGEVLPRRKPRSRRNRRSRDRFEHDA
jgi:hypothetical protein